MTGEIRPQMQRSSRPRMVAMPSIRAPTSYRLIRSGRVFEPRRHTKGYEEIQSGIFVSFVAFVVHEEGKPSLTNATPAPLCQIVTRWHGGTEVIKSLSAKHLTVCHRPAQCDFLELGPFG